jgi:hypothetical protein
MSAEVANRVDFKLTESLLISQPGVLDASVWLAEGRLMAHVTLSQHADWSERGLKVLCARELGLTQTPSQVMMLQARSLAA